MKTWLMRCMVVSGLLAGWLPPGSPAHAQTVSDNFESYALGAFPAPKWSDVGTVLPIPGRNPVPSAHVIATTDAFGHPTQALATIDAIAECKGIYAGIPVGSFYTLSVDVRPDRYSDHPTNPAIDFAMEVGFAQVGVANFAGTPSVGIYASSLKQDWRLYLISASGGPTVDIDFGSAATLGTWYHLQLDVNATTGSFHSRISDIAAGTVVTDRVDTIAGWQPKWGVFDSVALFGGDTALGDTVPTQATVDNANIAVAPESGSIPLLLGPGVLGAGLLLRRLRK